MQNNDAKLEREEKDKSFKKVTWTIIIVCMVCFLVYPVGKLIWAKTRVNKYCEKVSEEYSIDELREIATEMGLKFRSIPVNESIKEKVMVSQGWAQARWICRINYSNGKIIEKGVVFLD